MGKYELALNANTEFLNETFDEDEVEPYIGVPYHKGLVEIFPEFDIAELKKSLMSRLRSTQNSEIVATCRYEHCRYILLHKLS